MAMSLPKFPNDPPKVFFYYPLLRIQSFGDVIEYRCSGNLKNNSKLLKTRVKSLENTCIYHMYFQGFCPDLNYTSQ